MKVWWMHARWVLRQLFAASWECLSRHTTTHGDMIFCNKSSRRSCSSYSNSVSEKTCIPLFHGRTIMVETRDVRAMKRVNFRYNYLNWGFSFSLSWDKLSGESSLSLRVMFLCDLNKIFLISDRAISRGNMSKVNTTKPNPICRAITADYKHSILIIVTRLSLALGITVVRLIILWSRGLTSSASDSDLIIFILSLPVVAVVRWWAHNTSERSLHRLCLYLVEFYGLSYW